jgi:pyrimidine operon attenuation protein/uracil phosphoribosyltransferase
MIAGMSTQPISKPKVREKAQLMSASEIERTLVRLAHEIIEKNNGTERLVLIGIRRRGVPLAARLAKILERIENKPVPVGTLDIALYRDDLSTVGPRPEVRKGEIGCEVTDQDVVLVDDVLYTGRTTRAALDALFDHGRPRRVQLLALIDRGHRELPIEAAFVGRTVQTSRRELIEVKLQEVDAQEKVLLMEREDQPYV